MVKNKEELCPSMNIRERDLALQDHSLPWVSLTGSAARQTRHVALGLV